MDTIEVLPIRIRVVSVLRNALLSGKFHAGEELSLTEVANNLGVSRTPVREAFQTLAAEGLLELRMNKSAVVIGVDKKVLLDHYEMRRLLEGEAAARAARLYTDISDLIELQSKAENLMGTMETNDYRRYNEQFHMRIWQIADNSKLNKFLSEIWNGPSVGRVVHEKDHLGKSIIEHRVILNYLEARDEEGCRHAMEIHVTQGLDNMLQGFQL